MNEASGFLESLGRILKQGPRLKSRGPRRRVAPEKKIFSRWDIYSYVILAVVLLFQVASWFKMPMFLDCYYHLSVMRGFNDAGGWVGTAFWEDAPVGRPHLYPPFFHLLELLFFKAGLGPIAIARLFDILIYPLFLFAVWHVLKNLYSLRLAFFSLFLLTSSYTLYLALLNNTPFTLAFIFGFLSYYSFVKSRYLASLLWLALSFYTHSLMPWLIVLAILLDCFFHAQERKYFFRVWLGALLLASPLLVHQLKFLNFVRTFRAVEFYYAELDPLLYLLALGGGILVVKSRRPATFFLALTLSLSLLLFTHRNRFLSGHGLIPLSLLAAVCLDEVWERLTRQGRLIFKVIFLSVLLFMFQLFTPLVCFTPLKKGPQLLTTTWLGEQTGLSTYFTSSKEKSVYYPKFMNEIVRLVREKTSEDDILFSNFSYAGGMVAVLSHRATSTAMLAEVRPFRPFDRIAFARFIVWFKDPEGGFSPYLAQAIEKYKLKKIGETELIYLYENEQSRFKRNVVASRLPLGLCFVFLFSAFAGIALDSFGVRGISKKKLT
jgi:hypothetical protein